MSPLPGNILDREYDKFGLTGSGKTAVRIIGDGASPVPVYIVAGDPEGEGVSEYAELSSVSSGIESTIISYVVPPSKSFFLIRADVSGTNISDYKIKVNGSTIARKLTYFGGDLSTQFEFLADNLLCCKLLAGDILSITTKHGRPNAGDFFARLQGFLL